MAKTESTAQPASTARPAAGRGSACSAGASPSGNRRRWHRFSELFTTLLKASVYLGVMLLLIVALGLAQRLGWISTSGGTAGADHTAKAHEHGQSYTCPMHPQIRQAGPGRCPICGMELVPAADEKSGSHDELAVHIEPAARRIAGIETTMAQEMVLHRTIRSVGEIAFDESRLATITAWVGGRIERLFADYTGVKVREGDHLVHLYSPDLYAAQVEYLVARQSVARNGNRQRGSVRDTNNRLLEDSREKLQELGMTEGQIRELDESGKAQTRLKIYAPLGGTVIAKSKVEGEYVKTGDAIYRIANLSTVWLMLEVFPDDASQIRYGQRVKARVQSLPGEVFSGRVSFIDPTIDEETRTVGVRVDIDNRHGRLRPGDYASATIRIPITNGGKVYDAEIAGKWISPRHPQIIRDEPGQCPLCDIELVPTSEFGFTEQPVDKHKATVVPRDAVLMAGSASVVYVETEPGRFEIRPVVLGPIIEQAVSSDSDSSDSQSMAVILTGVKPGEKVATSGNFLIDSQMQLTGRPSVIDPTRLKASPEPGPLKLDDDQPQRLAGDAGVALDRLYSTYFAIHKQLAADTRPHANVIEQLLAVLEALQRSSDLPGAARGELSALVESADELKGADLEESRQRFKPVSQGIVRLAAQVRGPQTAGTFIHFYCPMVEGGGGDWLQPGEPLANPYFGTQMLRCGKAVHRLAAGSAASTATPSTADPEPDAPLPVPVPTPDKPVKR